MAIILMALMIGAAAAKTLPAQEGREGVVWGTFSFDTVHGVMQSLERALNELLGAFLAGDGQRISRQADLIAAEVTQVTEAFSESPNRDRQLWAALTEISKHARRMQSAAGRGEYQQAYRHFSRLTGRCVQCHERGKRP